MWHNRLGTLLTMFLKVEFKYVCHWRQWKSSTDEPNLLSFSNCIRSLPQECNHLQRGLAASLNPSRNAFPVAKTPFTKRRCKQNTKSPTVGQDEALSLGQGVLSQGSEQLPRMFRKGMPVLI